MELSWMGEYRDLVEALIHYCNIYAASYKPEKLEYKGIKYSYAQIQVLEYILEAEGSNTSMTVIADRLGVSKSNFSKIISRLSGKKLVTKVVCENDKRNTYIKVTDLGKELYDQYSKDILKHHFSLMFDNMQMVPKEHRDHMRDALFAAVSNLKL